MWKIHDSERPQSVRVWARVTKIILKINDEMNVIQGNDENLLMKSIEKMKKS